MAQSNLLSERDEARALRMMQNQPASAVDLQALLAKVAARAVQAVAKDPKVTKRLEGARSRVVGSDLSVSGTDLKGEKPAAGKKTASPVAEVGIYDYDRNVLVVTTVDLRRGTVAGIEERSGIQPLLTAEELAEAKQIVLSDPKFQSLKKRSGLEVVAFPARAAFDPSHPAYGHRCFSLYFWTSGRQPKRVAEAVVDLSAQQLYPWSEAGSAGMQDERS